LAQLLRSELCSEAGSLEAMQNNESQPNVEFFIVDSRTGDLITFRRLRELPPILAVQFLLSQNRSMRRYLKSQGLPSVTEGEPPPPWINCPPF
jgi:hypothetical protein